MVATKGCIRDNKRELDLDQHPRVLPKKGNTGRGAGRARKAKILSLRGRSAAEPGA
jgi:hypothetical protein